ncbi:MauE/DoxX family redox-associated membrane protein [Snuella lapsa]|uniref:Methylamine utilisation protein MauE domain-containing protein n=1 Tax=Snuella lapsa TaxID=870481 RepID=A0ABP6XWU7_9FLAO
MKSSKASLHFITKTIGTIYIILFVYAATSKLIDFNEFRIQLGQSPILTAYADWVAWGIPLLELALAGLFLVPKYTLYAFYGSFTLMTMFTTYIVLVLNFSDYIPCSCGGVLEDLGWTEHIVFNLVLTIMVIFGTIHTERHLATFKTTAP